MQRVAQILSVALLAVLPLRLCAQVEVAKQVAGADVKAAGQAVKNTVDAAPPTAQFSAKEERRAARQLARQQKMEAKAQADASRRAAKETDVVWVFGVGMNLNDSVVYLTDIQAVPYMKLEKKTKFLPYRVDFSQQFKEHLEQAAGAHGETTCMFYDVKRKKVAKRFYKMKKRYLDMGTSQLIIVDEAQFRFQKPDYDNVAL